MGQTQQNKISDWQNCPILAVYSKQAACATLHEEQAFITFQSSRQLIAANAYYQANRPGTSPLMKTRQAVFSRMQQLIDWLSPHYGISVFDAYRTLETQRDLYDEFYQIIKRDYPDWSDEAIRERTELFIANPLGNQHYRYPAHNTGGAIDLSLFDLTSGSPLDFGTEIDSLSDQARTDFFEQDWQSNFDIELSRWKKIRDNRRILFHAMKALNFVNLPSEWWHYDIGNENWAHAYGTVPVFAGL